MKDAKTDHDYKEIQRLIDATDKEIDRLVYDLYDLTEKEIRIVEGRGEDNPDARRTAR